MKLSKKSSVKSNTTLPKHYDPSDPTILSGDASTKGSGATLWQEDETGRRPVAFASRFLNSAEHNYAIKELELLVAKLATENFQQYLLGRRLIIETDHKAFIAVFNRHLMYK